MTWQLEVYSNGGIYGQHFLDRDQPDGLPSFMVEDACLEEVPGWRDIFPNGHHHMPGTPYFSLDLGTIPNSERDYTLQLSDTGLVKKTAVLVRQGLSSAPSLHDKIHVLEKDLGPPEIHDFALMATLPVKRFPYLAEDIPAYSEAPLQEAFAEFPSGEIYLGPPKNLIHIDWSKAQDAVSAKFHTLFTSAVEQNTSRYISPNQANELSEMVGCLVY